MMKTFQTHAKQAFRVCLPIHACQTMIRAVIAGAHMKRGKMKIKKLFWLIIGFKEKADDKEKSKN